MVALGRLPSYLAAPATHSDSSHSDAAVHVKTTDANYIDLTDGGATALHSHASGGGHTIQDDNADMATRTKLSFQDGFVLADDAGGDQTEVDLSYGAAGYPLDIATAESDGIALTVARSDHVHAHEAAHIAHDTLWDAAGDMLVGTGANTGGRVAIGTDGQAWISTGTTAAWETPWLQQELVDLAQGSDKCVVPFPKQVGANYTTLRIDFGILPSVPHSFTFFKNGISVGAVTCTTSGTSSLPYWTTTVAAFDMNDTNADVLSVRHDTNAQDGDESASHTNEGLRIWASIF